MSNYSFVDSITIGEPEHTFLELTEAVINNKDSSALFSINGLAFNSLSSETGIIKNKPREPISNIDNLPFPYRHCFEIFKGRGIATYVLASRGCYGKCTFCYLNQFYAEESLWRGRSPENVMDEICHLYREYGERYFYFADANFFGPGRKGKEWADKLARMIIEQDMKINFGIECRVNDVEEKLFGLLVKAGLRDVFLGVESGSQNSLDRFRKNTTVEQNKKAINILRQFNIEPNYGFIIFDPDSTLEEVRENFEFLREMEMFSSPSITAHLMHHRQTLFKGTPDYEKRKDIVESICRFNYEYIYNFRDERVEALAKDVELFCSKVLKDLSRNRGLEKERDSCFYDETDSFSKKLNEKLIEHFEKTLSTFEETPICA